MILQYGTVHWVCTDTVFVYSTQHNIIHFVGYTAIDTADICMAYSCVFPGTQPTIAFSAWLSFSATHPCSDNMTHWHNVCLAKKIADAKHPCLIIKNYDSPTECTSCENFCRCKTCLPDNQKLWLPNWTYILWTFYAMQNATCLVAIEGPWLIWWAVLHMLTVPNTHHKYSDLPLKLRMHLEVSWKCNYKLCNVLHMKIDIVTNDFG